MWKAFLSLVVVALLFLGVGYLISHEDVEYEEVLEGNDVDLENVDWYVEPMTEEEVLMEVLEEVADRVEYVKVDYRMDEDGVVVFSFEMRLKP